MKTKQGRSSIARRRARNGWLSISPFVVGFFLFFFQPLVLSFYYSFTNITPSEMGYDFVWTGLSNFEFLFNQDVEFLPAVSSNLQTLVTEVPVITLFSLFFAVVLNQKFRGRTFMRAVAFLPVIITSGIVITILNEDVFNTTMRLGSMGSGSMFTSSGLAALLETSNLPTFLTTFITNAVTGIFDMLWKTGVQILIFLAALQSISSSLYEAARVEGATAWESFWKVTFPMISPMILVSVIYTIVDSFTSYDNPVMKLINREGVYNMRYSYACAMSWIFLIAVFLVIGAAYLLITKLLVHRHDR